MSSKKHTDSAQSAKSANRLLDETSPYLLQHAHNPVDWYPWGQEALDRSRKQDMPIMLSIGYAACHWCHVMEHESFEDHETADFMNQHFVCIKVDREERPDLDDIYMKAVQMMTGHGGWPMTVFLTPELKPFFGGTYYPPEDRHGMPSFKRVLSGVAHAWQHQRSQVEASSKELTEYLGHFNQAAKGSADLNYNHIEQSMLSIFQAFDRQWGGLGNAPKFPHSFCLDLAMRFAAESKASHESKATALEFIDTTLNKMAYGGMHDQIGGGFARYSVDRQWLIPHFEKMLYDNATLSRAYLQGYLLRQDEYWLRVARRCLDFVLRDLTANEGVFYSSLDADSEGVEGKFYVWTPAEIIALLGQEDGSWLNEVYGVTAGGNFEHGQSALHLVDSPAALAVKYDLTIDEFWRRLDKLGNTLLTARNLRIAPGRDEKALTSWNALMISSLAMGYRVVQDARYRDAATKAAKFILDKMMINGRLLRTFGKGQAKLNAYLDDYAFMVQALLDLAAIDFDSTWLTQAVVLNDTMLKHFYDDAASDFFYTSDDHEELLTRPKNFFDGSIPSGTSVAVLNLLRLAKITGQNRYQKIAEDTLKLYAGHFAKGPDQFSNMLCALDFYLSDSSELVLVANKEDRTWQDMFQEINTHYLPNTTMVLKDNATTPDKQDVLLLKERVAIADKPTVYLCRNYTCEAPITDSKNLSQALK